QPGEQCDDGNGQDGDGCTANCTLEGQPLCGDGIVQPQNGEQCDDGNAVDGDGCAVTCLLEG
ncbi:Myxococcus cysteine-rich repeat-containing protein, partial [Nannocystis exedens]